MRVLHVTPYFAPAFRYGGPAHSVLGLCRGLKESDVDVEVLTTTADGDDEIAPEVVRRGEFDGVPVRYLERRFPRCYFNASGLVDSLRRTLSTVDLVHVNGLWTFPAWLAALESRRRGVPFIVSPRGMLDSGSMAHRRMRKRIGYWLRERRYLRDAALLHATSVEEEATLKRFALGPRIVHVPNGVVAPAKGSGRGFRERFGIDDVAGVVVFLGRLHPIKRLDLLMAAFERVRAGHPGARLLLAGPEDGLRATALVGSADGVRWVGELGPDEKWALLRAADVLVSCSDSESFGMSIVEAMAAGTPVVVTQTCPWQEVETVGAGLWVPQRPEDIAEGISRILRNPGDARMMGERGRNLVDERYRWTSIARAMLSQYQSVVEQKTRELSHPHS